MVEIEFSVMCGDSEAFNVLQSLLQRFTAHTRIHVHVTTMPWDTAWNQTLDMALRGQGADLSEISTTWLADLTSMRALQPVPGALQAQLGQGAGYLRGSWQSCQLPDDPQLWALPWLAGTHVLYYRRDWFTAAGLNPQSAFATPTALEAALHVLQTRGITRPWVVSTQGSPSTIRHLTSWIGAAGGDFISPDGKRILFAEPPALAGMAAYFNLRRYLGPEPEKLNDAYATQLFWSGQAAATIEGQWMYAAQKNHAAPEVRDHLGVAQVPGVSCVGGSNLVVWRYTRSPDAAWELARYLTDAQSAALYTYATNLLPPRWDLFEASVLSADPVYRLFTAAIDQGRAWPPLPFSTLIETRLTHALQEIWQALLNNPTADTLTTLETYLRPLQHRLQLTLDTRG